MALKNPLRRRAGALAAFLMLTLAFGAEPKPAPTPVGATRAQVTDRLGEPRRVLTAGNREVLLYPHERLVLRDGVVVEVEPILDAPTPPPAPRRSAPPESAAPANADASETPRPATKSAAPVSPANPPAPNAAVNPAAAAEDNAGERATEPPPPSPADTQVTIKAVRPAGSAPRVAPKTDAIVAPASAENSAKDQPRSQTAGAPTASAPASTSPAAKAPAATAPASTRPMAPTELEPNPDTAPTPADAAVADAESKTEVAPVNGKASADDIKKAKLKAARRRLADAAADAAEEPEPVFSPTSYVIAFVIVAGGIGLLVWRRRQHQLAMAATTVSRTPFMIDETRSSGARFKPEMLARLEWKRFEELVASYYNKTGVVATRTKSGPSSPVQVKISWKGEPRPFAYVQCIAHPEGLIGIDRLQALVAVLTTEDIRRGYVVSTGRFSVEARDFGEEKHLTLLPGEIFIEKLNALPDAARTELMQEIMAGDPGMPSCPKCETKMARIPDDPLMARCPNHPDQVLPVRR